MEKEASTTGEKKRSLFWIGLIILVVMMGALGWQAKSLLQPSGATSNPAPIRAKVPPVPPPATIPVPEPESGKIANVPDGNEAETHPLGADSQGTGNVEQSLEAALSEAGIEIPETPSEPIAATEHGPAEISPKPADQSGQTANETASTLANQPEARPEEKAPILEDQPAAKAPAPDSVESQTAAASEPSPANQIEQHKQAPPQTNESPDQPSADETPKPYTIQVGAFRVKAYAVDNMSHLIKSGYEAYIFKIDDANKKPWYAVRFGHFETRDQATQALLEFKDKEQMDGIISRSDAL